MAALVFLGALVVVAAWGMAWLANARSAGAPAARRVALLLFVLGADVATSIIGLLPVLPPREGGAVAAIHWMLDTAVPPLTLLFMARALDTPVARVLRRRGVEAALVVLAVAGAAGVWAAAHRVPLEARFTRGPGMEFVPYLFGYVAVGFLVALVLALHAWRTAEGPERRRTGMFAVAFGILDVAWAAAFGLAGLLRFSVALQVVYGVGALVFTLVLGYAILQHRLLGIDVKVRFAISRSTVAAVFIAVFFVASEGAQLFFGRENQVVGLVAAGALVFAMAPLQRAADRLAERAVPAGTPVAPASPASASKQEDAYRRAVRLALRDRRLTHEEEIHLFHVAEALGIPAGRAMELRHEVEREATA